MRADSTEKVSVSITTKPVGVVLGDDTFDMAFVLDKDAIATSWHSATYDATTGLISCLVGPVGGVVLAPATYIVLIRVTDAPEVPVLACPGKLKIEALT